MSRVFHPLTENLAMLLAQDLEEPSCDGLRVVKLGFQRKSPQERGRGGGGSLITGTIVYMLIDI